MFHFPRSGDHLPDHYNDDVTLETELNCNTKTHYRTSLGHVTLGHRTTIENYSL